MKKIETWEDLKEAFKDNKDISFKIITTSEDYASSKIISYGESIVLNQDVAFNQKGQLLIWYFDRYEDEECWREEGVKNRTYQQIYNIIKLMLE